MNNEKKLFEAPEVEVILFEGADVLTSSGNGFVTEDDEFGDMFN